MSSSESEPQSRPTVRYEAQSQGGRFAAEEQANTWVGAFERVLGDHAEQEAAAASVSSDRDRKSYREYPTADFSSDVAPPTNQPKPSPRRPLPSRQRSKSHLRNAWVPGDSSLTNDQKVQAGLSGDASLQQQQMLHPASAAAAPSSIAPPPSSTTARLSHKGSNRALKPSTSQATASGPVISSSTTPQVAKPAPIRSYGPAPEGQEDDDDDDGERIDDPRGARNDSFSLSSDRTTHNWISDASLGLTRTASGPTMLEVTSRHQKDAVAFTDLYLNHAPGLQPVRLRNTLGHGKSVLVRLESDMGRAVSFMRRKRTAPKNELAKLSWPSNTLSWARSDGLSPQNLRELRAISVNLEVADSLILEGGASTEVFVIFRPSLLPENTGPANATIQPPSNGTSRPMSRASSVAPSSQTVGDQRSPANPINPAEESASPATPSEPAVPAPGTSPRSAPEILRPSRGPSSSQNPRLAPREANGKITIRAWQLPSLQSQPSSASLPSVANRATPPAEGGTNDDGSGAPTSSRSSAASSRPTSLYAGSTVSSGGASLSTTITDLAEPQLVELPLLARFCRPQIALSVRQPGTFVDNEGTRIPTRPQRQGVVVADFGDTVAGEATSTEVTLHNQSEIDCFWQCKVDCEGDEPEAPPCVSISSMDSGEELDVVRPSEGGAAQYRPHVLPPSSSTKFKLTLRPQHAGTDMEEIVTFTNLHNTSNAVRIAVRANVQAQGKQLALQVASGDFLDFGDCCGGQWTRQLLILRNVSDHSLDVTLNAQKGHEVAFQFAELADVDDFGAEDMQVGATAASSDASSVVSDLALSETASSSGGERSSGRASTRSAVRNSPVTDLDRSPLESHRSIAMELIRTPTHHASLAPYVEPPTFELGNSATADTADLERTPLVTPYAHPPAPSPHADADSEENSSIASQAGSRPTSPAPAPDPTRAAPSGSEPEAQSSEALKVPDQSAADVVKKDRTHNSVLAWREAHGVPGPPEPSERNLAQSGSFSSSTGAASAWMELSSASRKDDEAVSTTSEVTSHSQGNRSTGLSVHSRSVSSAQRSHRASAASGLRSVESKDSKDLNELNLRPEEEVRVIVSFRPARREPDENFSAGRLAEETFRLILDHTRARSTTGGSGTSGSHLRPRSGRERKVVLCRIRTCTSFISVAPAQLDFGEVNVGTRKSGQIEVFNHSDLSARVDLRFVSKVLSMYRDEMAIPANQSIHLSVDYSPRRVNLAYSKQITVANLLNRHNDQIVEVRGKNVDKQRISFHSLFYRILTPHGSNFLEFGDVNINSSRVRTFSIENTSKASLTLDITTAHPEDVALYVKAAPKRPAASSVGSEGVGSQSQSSTAGLLRVTKGYEEVEPNTIAKSTVSRALSGDGSKPSSNPKGAELKERFLESISSDTPANVRQENTSWRTAQQLSHTRKGAAAPASVLGSSKEGFTPPAGGGSKPPKQTVNLVSALKKGGKGRITLGYGKSVTFKDRALLQAFENLDLASGPPLTANRISVKSKCFQMLEQLEVSSKGKTSKDKTGVSQDDGAASSQDTDIRGGADPSAVSAPARTSATSPLPPSTPTKPKQTIPAPLAREIRSKAGTPSKAIPKAVATGSDRSPALTGKKKVRPTALEPGDVANLSLDELLAALESQASTLSTLFFNSAQAEEKHVRTEINLLRELRQAVETKQLEPLEMLEVAPGEERQVIAIYCPNGSTRPHIQGTARKQDSRIFLRLVDFDVSAVRDSEEFAQMANLDKDELPIRDLMVRTTTCRALLELGQPHINFGAMERGESKTRKILIHNRSEWAARYCIRKSGSIASGDIKLSSGRYGVVSAHGKREVEFVFSPSLTGPFQEKLIIENVADRDRDLTVFLKANVRKKPNFTVDPTVIDFGDCKPGKLAEPRSFTVSNTTNKARTFVVAVDSSDLRHQRTIMDLVFTASSDGDSRSKAEDASIADEIEHLSQKLKIATRKGHEDKVKKYENRLTELGVNLGKSGVSAAENETQETRGDTAEASSGGIAATSIPTAPVAEEPASSRLKRVSSTVTVGLAANQSKRITVRLRTSAVHTALTAKDALAGEGDGRQSPEGGAEGEDVSFVVQIHELKNQDETINVTVRARALWAQPSASPPAALSSQLEAQVAGADASAEERLPVVVLPPSANAEEANVGADSNGEEGQMDPLPNDASAIIFTSNT